MGPLTRRQLLTAALVGPPFLTTGLALPAAGLTINRRETWALDRPPLGSLPAEDVRFLLVHHSASRNGHTGADAPGILRSFYDFHTGEKGWNDIAYNFLIDADGGVWEGRHGSISGPVAGDATGGNQGFSQLVCVIGDYNQAQPTSASLNSLVLLLGWLADRYGIATTPGSVVTFVSRGSNRWPAGTEVTTPTITGHRTMSKTTCPGDHLYAYVADGLTADVHAARAGSSPPPSSTTTPSTTTSSTTTSSTTTSSTTTSSTTTTSTTAPAAAEVAPTTRPPAISATESGPLSAEPTTRPSQESALVTDTSIEDSPLAAQRSSLLVGAAAMLAGGAGLVLWRYNRLRGR